LRPDMPFAIDSVVRIITHGSIPSLMFACGIRGTKSGKKTCMTSKNQFGSGIMLYTVCTYVKSFSAFFLFFFDNTP